MEYNILSETVNLGGVSLKLIHTTSNENFLINIYETNTFIYVTNIIRLEDEAIFNLPKNSNKNSSILIAERLLKIIPIAKKEGYSFNGKYFVHPFGIEIGISLILNLDVSISYFKNYLCKKVDYLTN